MRSFYIAMGQGVVARADLEIFTEALYSCTLIAGHSSSRTRGGAFHYPAESLSAVRRELQQWMDALRPVRITLVFAQEVSPGMGMGTTQADQARLISWFQQNHPSVRLETTSASSACMTLVGGHYYAGTTHEDAYWDDSVGTDLMELAPGEHREYTLFDARPRLSQSSAAVVAESRGGRSRRKRSFMKRCIVM